MAYAEISFSNPITGEIKEAPVGFSWTTAFFGIFPSLFRGDYKWFIIMTILALMTFGLSHFVFMFIYNKLYIKKLIGDGFKADESLSTNFEKAVNSIGMNLPIVNP